MFELQLGGNGFTYARDVRYVDNLVAGAKLHFVDQDEHRPSLAVTASISVPTASQRGYVRLYDAAIIGQASKDLGRVHLDLNVGLALDDLGGARSYQSWLAGAAAYAVTGRVSLALEPHYFTDAAPTAPRDAGIIAALEVAASAWLVFDAAVDVVGWDQRSVSALVGMSIAPVRLWGSPR